MSSLKVYPNYNKIGRNEILANSDEKINLGGKYLYDENLEVNVYKNQIEVIELENALKCGKTCKRYTIYKNEFSYANDIYQMIHFLKVNGIYTYRQLYESILKNEINMKISEIKGIRTFTPFKKIKTIKIPKLWTISHVWKAIISEQIYEGIKDAHYSDDYAYDNENNFGKGKLIDLKTFAYELIRSPNGWYVHENKKSINDDVIELSVNCCGFDYNILYFRKISVYNGENKINEK